MITREMVGLHRQMENHKTTQQTKLTENTHTKRAKINDTHVMLLGKQDCYTIHEAARTSCHIEL